MEALEDMERTITGNGKFWLVYDDYILTDDQVRDICNKRISAMMKLMPMKKTKNQREYLANTIKLFEHLKERVEFCI